MKNIFQIYNIKDLNDFLKTKTIYNLSEKNLTLEQIQNDWKFVGNNESNYSNIGMLTNGEKGIIERITNGIDAVLEKQKEKHALDNIHSHEPIIQKAFPEFYKSKKEIMHSADVSNDDLKLRNNARDADSVIYLAIYDGSRKNSSTIDIVDKGSGIEGKDFANTILSLHNGNKLNEDKSYLIGAFGQGGSTSLPFSAATIIISKKNNEFFYTVIKEVKIKKYKLPIYMYLTTNGNIINLDFNDIDLSGLHKDVQEFINAESGTLVRMIDINLKGRYFSQDINKPGMFGDYVNTELFNVALPINIRENRREYIDKSGSQNRNAYGAQSRLWTTKYVQKKYSGTFKVNFWDIDCPIDYYTILPVDENNWVNDSKCRETFGMFNTQLKPIIFTVSGQVIVHKGFTRLKNEGLSFLEHRLLVVINLDVFGPKKYDFFTSNRDGIKDTAEINSFINQIIKELGNLSSLLKINEILQQKAVKGMIDSKFLEDLKKELKDSYLPDQNINQLLSISSDGHHISLDDSENFSNIIEKISITTTKSKFYKNHAFSIYLTTSAKKEINNQALPKIKGFLGWKYFEPINVNAMNGRIKYDYNAAAIGPGQYELIYQYFPDHEPVPIESNTLRFEILDENGPEEKTKIRSSSFDIDIKIVTEKEFIADIVKDYNKRQINIYLCMDHEFLKNEIYSYFDSNNKIELAKKRLIEFLAHFVLAYENEYSEKTLDAKNDLILAFLKAWRRALNSDKNKFFHDLLRDND